MFPAARLAAARKYSAYNLRIRNTINRVRIKTRSETQPLKLQAK